MNHAEWRGMTRGKGDVGGGLLWRSWFNLSGEMVGESGDAVVVVLMCDLESIWYMATFFEIDKRVSWFTVRIILI